jgi:hypothetical protein
MRSLVSFHPPRSINHHPCHPFLIVRQSLVGAFTHNQQHLLQFSNLQQEREASLVIIIDDQIRD